VAATRARQTEGEVLQIEPDDHRLARVGRDEGPHPAPADEPVRRRRDRDRLQHLAQAPTLDGLEPALGASSSRYPPLALPVHW
jgi:hypothetical protein